MSFLSGLGSLLKKGAPIIGGILGNAILPGVGGVLGAGLGGAISKSGKGSNVGSVLGGAGMGALGGAAANAASAGPGFSLGSLFGSGGSGVENPNEQIQTLINAGIDPQTAAKMAGGGGGLSSLLGGNPLATLGKLGLAGAGIANSASSQGKANAIADEQLKQMQAQNAVRSQLLPLFAQKVQNLPMQSKDLGSVFKSQNPFQRAA